MNNVFLFYFKAKFPNSPDHPTVLSALCDENDSFAMNVCGQAINFYKKLLEENIMEIDGLKFQFIIWTSRDGKWLSKSTGHVGQASDFYCNRCLIDKNDGENDAEPRTTSLHNSLATIAAINPESLNGEDLYQLCRGSKSVAISPINISLTCYDELHWDIDIVDIFISLAKCILALCEDGQTHIPQGLIDGFPTLSKYADRMDAATSTWNETVKKELNFRGTARNLSQNPGNFARLLLTPSEWSKMMRIIPNCEAKIQLQTLFTKFNAVR